MQSIVQIEFKEQGGDGTAGKVQGPGFKTQGEK